MSMSTSVYGFREPDEKWKKMKEVYDVCKKNKVEIPEEVNEFFNFEPPSDEGIEVRLDHIYEPYRPNDCSDGFKIEISKLPKNIKYICFVNSY